MNVSSQNFENEEQKIFYNITKGFESVNILNVKKVVELLPDKDTMLSLKYTFARDLLSWMQRVDNNLYFSERDFEKFSEFPLELNKKTFDEKTISMFEKAKDNMSFINMFANTYCASLSTIIFLWDRCNKTESLNRELLKKYDKLLIELNEKDRRKELNTLKIDELGDKTDNSLLMSEEEKALIEKENIEKIDKEEKEEDFVEEEVTQNANNLEIILPKGGVDDD